MLERSLCRVRRLFVYGAWALLICSASCSSVGYHGLPDDSASDRDEILRRLNVLFQGSCPRSIMVTRTDRHPSEFHVGTSTIELGTDAVNPNETIVLRHETVHLCMAHLTKGASIRENNRFYDEGFATIVGGDYSTSYRKRALAVATKKAAKGEVSFEKVQRWSKYFGEPPNADYDAYDVGASFVFFVQDTYGQDRLFNFFRATGQAADLNDTCKSVFGETASTVERKWIAYLKRIPVT